MATPSSPATRGEVARLLGRVAFGATAADLDHWTGRPYVELVEQLLAVPDPATRAPLPDDERRVALQQATRNAPGAETPPAEYLRQAQGWWLERMRTTPWPLEERMTLMWHGLFATAADRPRPDVSMLLAQNQTLRLNALGNFRSMLAAVTLDPAMLHWLDGAQNATPAPNENYAREFFELFTLGKYPAPYTETDIRQAARVLTGWSADPNTRTVSFSKARHDQGTKTVLGRTIGNLDDREYHELIGVALDHPMAARFVALKLVADLAYVPAAANLLASPDPLVAKVASALRASNWDLREAVRALVLADEFRHGSGADARQLVRQPAELVAASGRLFNVRLDDNKVLDVLSRMGQRLFDPPNVGGWPRGPAWLSPVTELARYDWGIVCHAKWNGLPLTQRPAVPATDDLDGWAARVGLDALSPTTRSALSRYLAEQRTAADVDRRAGLVALLFTSPEWTVI